MKRWAQGALYALVLLLLLLLEWLCRLLPGGMALPLLLPLAVGTAAALEGPAFGAGYGLSAGLLAYMSRFSGGGEIVLFALLGGLCGLLQDLLPKPLPRALLAGGFALLAASLSRGLFWWLAGRASLAAAAGAVFWDVLLSLPALPLVYLLCRSIQKSSRHSRAEGEDG